MFIEITKLDELLLLMMLLLMLLLLEEEVERVCEGLSVSRFLVEIVGERRGRRGYMILLFRLCVCLCLRWQT